MERIQELRIMFNGGNSLKSPFIKKKKDVVTPLGDILETNMLQQIQRILSNRDRIEDHSGSAGHLPSANYGDGGTIEPMGSYEI